MNENAPRSVCLVVLMIAAIALPLMQTGPPAELEVVPAKEEVAANPCQGYDACLGLDAGGYNGRNEVCPGGTGTCLLYTSDAADDLLCVDLGGRRII